MPVIYDSRSLPERERFPVWREVVCENFLQLRAERMDDGPFHGLIDVEAVGSIGLVEVALGPAIMTRGAREIARGADAGFAVQLPSRGVIWGRRAGNEMLLRPGEMALTYSTEPFQMGSAADYRATVLAVPSAAMLARAPRLEASALQRPSGGPGVCALLGAYAAAVRAQAPRLDATGAAVAASHLCDLIAAAFSASPSVREIAGTAVRAARLEALLRIMEAELHDPALSAESAGRELGVSARYVAKLFEPTGRTFGETLTGKRLEISRRLLADPAQRGRSVAEIAYACGFNDLSTFNRRFRARFGERPSAVRPS